MQGITRVRVQIQTEISVKISRCNSFLKLTLFLVIFLMRIKSHVVYWLVPLKTNREFSLLHHSWFKKDNLNLPFIFIKQRLKWVLYFSFRDPLFHETQVYHLSLIILIQIFDSSYNVFLIIIMGYNKTLYWHGYCWNSW